MFAAGIAVGYYLSFGRLMLDMESSMRAVAHESRSQDSDSSVKVRVLAKKYSWHFHYPGPDGVWGKTREVTMSPENPLGLDMGDPASGDDIHSQELVLPCEVKVTLLVSSADVIHVLGHIEGDFEADATPGVHSTGTLETPKAARAGILKCVQLCGSGYSKHHAPYRFVSRPDFDSWLAFQVTTTTAPK